MPTSIDTSVHFFAKKAKNRLSGRGENTPNVCEKYLQKEEETYQTLLRIAAEKQTVYNPISRLVGKDLKSVPDSPEKLRTVLEMTRFADSLRKRARVDLIQKARNNESVVIDGKEYDPLDLLRKLH